MHQLGVLHVLDWLDAGGFSLQVFVVYVGESTECLEFLYS